MKKKKENKEPIIIEEPYTCTVCGRRNLKFTEIVYKEDAEGQIDDSTVCCMRCGFITLVMPKIRKYVTPGREKDAEKLLQKAIAEFEYNYKRRLPEKMN